MEAELKERNKLIKDQEQLIERKEALMNEKLSQQQKKQGEIQKLLESNIDTLEQRCEFLQNQNQILQQTVQVGAQSLQMKGVTSPSMKSSIISPTFKQGSPRREFANNDETFRALMQYDTFRSGAPLTETQLSKEAHQWRANDSQKLSKGLDTMSFTKGQLNADLMFNRDSTQDLLKETSQSVFEQRQARHALQPTFHLEKRENSAGATTGVRDRLRAHQDERNIPGKIVSRSYSMSKL